MDTICFDESDFSDDLPQPGYYQSTITTARHRRSTCGNHMIQVVHAIEGVGRSHDRVSEYFVLEGSPRGVAMARRRLVQLYRACGLSPQSGDEISPADVLGARLEVKFEHDEWNGQRRLRVAGHRPLGSPSQSF